MAIDLNMDMGSIIKGLMSKHGAGGASFSGISAGRTSLAPYKIAGIILATVVLIAVVYISVVYIPLKEQNNKKAQELAKILEMKSQLVVLDGQIAALKKNLDKSKEQYLESLSHFGNSEDLGGLYQTVSTLAAKYALVVLNVKEIPAPPPVVAKPTAAAAKKDAKAAAEAPKKPAIDVREIKVEVELKGHYGNYMKFKEDLALAEILLKINAESIMVKDEKTDQGSIYVKLNLSTYAIDKKPFQGIISEDAHEKIN